MSSPARDSESAAWARSRFQELLSEESASTALAAVRVITEAISRSSSTTMMGLQIDLKEAVDTLKAQGSSTGVSSACDLFERFMTRVSLEESEFDKCKSTLIHRGEQFSKIIQNSAQKIANLADRFVQDNAQILVHGSLEPVKALLQGPATRKRFSVLVTESQPTGVGYALAKALQEDGIQATVIPDAAVAHYMEQVDIVLVGSDVVVENGGIINSVGTFQVAMLAHAFNKPFYVCAQSCKFSRIFPLNQRDLPAYCTQHHSKARESDKGVQIYAPLLDYTPPKYITLLITDLGVLTPSAVSEELIKLYL